MSTPGAPLDRRAFLRASAAAGLGAPGIHRGLAATDDAPPPAQVAITLDLEMSRHYPTWDDTHWDYEKGNLDAATKRYAVEAARRIKARGGRIHFFALGQTLEQPDVDWLKELAREGHPIGNHTYDHVNVKAQRLEDLQFRFQRCPWLVAGKTPREVIAQNIRLASEALRARIGVDAAGFRTPGGFTDGLADRPDLQQLVQSLGFTWVSSRYPAHPAGPPGRELTQALVAAQSQAQPFAYPSGLVEVPMSPISDVMALRAGRWPLEAFLEAIEACVEWAITHRAAFDFLAHPSCLVVMDPQFQVIERIARLVAAAGPRAQLVDLAALARRATPPTRSA